LSPVLNHLCAPGLSSSPQSWLKDAQNTFSGLDGPLSSGYAILTAAFLASGIGYLVLPGLTLKGVFGPAAGDGAEELLLWQLIGVGVSMLVGPICYSLKVSRGGRDRKVNTMMMNIVSVV
jgi:hypothetical protein